MLKIFIEMYLLIVLTVTIVVVSRLVYRKGVDLLAQIIADVCLKNQKVRFDYKSILTLFT